MRIYLWLAATLCPSLAFGQVIPCPSQWPSSCGALKPDPGGSLTGPGMQSVGSRPVQDVIASMTGQPQIVCRDPRVESDTRARELIAARLAKAPEYKDFNILQAIVPTLAIARYSSGVTVALGSGSEYFCINDRGDRIWYGR
ncbi:MAG: hypothetical protein U0136_19130 [Bdellovibrionota bacterium]